MPRSATLSPSMACTCGRLRRAARALTQLYDEAMAPSGLRVTQFSLLRTLSRDGPRGISDLAEALLLDRTALSRNLDPLVARNLVKVSPGRDGRTREVALTGQGEAALKEALPYWKKAQRHVSRELGVPRIDALIETLTAVESLHPGSRDSR